MTNEEARSILMGLVTRHNAFSKESAAICKAIDALKQTDVPDTNVGELISRQAVDELSKALVHTTRDKADFLCNFWEGLQKLPPVTPKAEQRWIPVSERLPEAKGCKEYIVTVAHFKPEYKARFVEVCEYDAREFWDGRIPTWERQEYDGGRVVAWMPLPEPYRAESEDNA